MYFPKITKIRTDKTLKQLILVGFAIGDTMGCGILFPRDYHPEWDADDGQEELKNDNLDERFPESDSEDEEWWERPNAENGTKVQVGNYYLYLISNLFHLFCRLPSISLLFNASKYYYYYIINITIQVTKAPADDKHMIEFCQLTQSHFKARTYVGEQNAG